MKELRQHSRVELGAGALCEIEGADALLVKVRDISLGGACVESEVVPLYGTELTVAVELPGSTHFSRLPATVRWAARGTFGVQFGLLGARDTHLIVSLIQRRVLEADQLKTVRPEALAPLELVQRG